MRKGYDERKRFSNNSIESDSLSQQSEYTPSPRPVRRKVSMATRRRSQLLYLEKYGLNQPGWHASQDDYEISSQHSNSINDPTNECTEEPEDMTDNTPAPVLEPAPSSSPPPARFNSGMKRPVSIRNIAQNTVSQKRPINYIKPQKSYTKQSSAIPNEFIPIQKLIDDYSEKVYMEGYLSKRNDLNSNGTSCGTNKIWSRWYVELCGPVLTLWDAELPNTHNDVFPQYINITDSTVNIENRLTAETKCNLFSLNSAGANRFLLQAEDGKALHQWILAIRLSCFECARIQEIYTKAFINRPQYITQQLLVIKKNTAIATEGFVQVRFPGATGWKKFWAVVSNRKTEKKLFNKKIVPTDGQIMFFESKKAKYPMMILENVVQVYTVYPESPQLINMATLFKIEGGLYKSKSNGHQKQLVSASSSALIMTSNTSELVQWLVGCFDAFKLYGRPDLLLEDSQNPKSLSFAGDKPQGRLFLELSEVLSVDSGYGTSLLGSKKEFSAILLDKLLRGVPFAMRTYARDMDDEPLIAAEPSSGRRRFSANQAKTNTTTLVQQPTHLRTVTCASDVSDDEEVDEEDKGMDVEESDSDESLYKLGERPTIITSNIINKSKPMTPNTSKSSSDTSEVSPATLPANSSTADFFLPPVTDMTIDSNNSFANSVLHQFNSHQKNPSKITVSSSEDVQSTASESDGSHTNPAIQRPFYAQQRSHSMVPLSQASQQHIPWPMYGSTASVGMGDYAQNSNNHANRSWDTASLDVNIMMNNGGHFNQAMDTDEEDEDDDVPIANYNSDAKIRERYSRATGQPFIQVSKNRTSAPLSVISEKDRRTSSRKDSVNTVDEQMMTRMMEQQRQQQLMMQQYMFQQYATNNGMVPMMMPMMDPRMMPMMDPRMMQPMVMYNPAIMSAPTSPMMTPIPPMMSPQSFSGGMISPSTSTTSSGQQRPRQQHRRQDSIGSSIGGDNRHTPHHKRLSTAGSITNSIQSGSRYYAASPTPVSTRRTTRNH